MGDARRPVAGLLLAGAAGLTGLVSLFWAAPMLLERLLSPAVPQTHHPGEAAPEAPEIDAFLTEQLAAIGAARAGTADTGPAPLVYRLTPGAKVQDAARQLRDAGRDAHIELHTAPIGDLDVEVRAYDGKALARRLILRETQAGMAPAPDAPTLRERPQVAVIIVDLGDQPPGDLLTVPVPLTLALPAFRPWTLRLAEDGMRHWHEILVDLDAAGGAPPGEQLHAVPYASGVFVRTATTPLPSPERLPHGVILHAGPQPDREAPSVQTIAPVGASATEALARAWATAARDGVAAVALSATDPTLHEAIQTVMQAEAAGYRLVLASEAARWEELRGIPSAETQHLNR